MTRDDLTEKLLDIKREKGWTWKQIQAEIGGGIISAIDFNMEMEREPNKKGDRVKLTMSGKFLPYTYYGAEEGVPEYGFKEG